MNVDTKRVCLWAHPRSLSTAFMRCIEGLPKTKVVFEPFVAAYLYGPGGKSSKWPDSKTDPEYSYEGVKKLLEQEHEESDLVFVKDMAVFLSGKYDFIPEGYQHTFLIRHPLKSYVSYDRCIKNYDDGNAYMELDFGKGSFYNELFELYKYLASKGEGNSLIIDADDLLKKPDVMMQLYCQHIGVEFRDSILQWGPAKTDNWVTSKIFMEKTRVLPYHVNSLKAGCFSKNVSKPAPSLDEISPDLQECIRAAMPSYEKLYKLRVDVNII